MSDDYLDKPLNIGGGGKCPVLSVNHWEKIKYCVSEQCC